MQKQNIIKTSLGILLCIALLTSAGAIYTNQKEESKPAPPTKVKVTEQPTTDNFYYRIELVNGKQYVARINNYPSGKIELYLVFVEQPDGELIPYDRYLQQQQLEQQGGGIVNYPVNPTVTLRQAEIKAINKLPEDSSAIKAINEYAEQQDQEFTNQLSQ